MSNDNVQKLQQEAREAYRRHQSPETQAAARQQLAQARMAGNEAAGAASSRTGGQK